jgi:NCS1 family nucleobase:cation symporter-1
VDAGLEMMDKGAAAPALGGGIEARSIDYVPRSMRHGKLSDQAPFWFLGNFQFFTVAIGFIGPGLGLSFGYTALAGISGVLFGTVFMAFHAAQGAHLGLPQMIQSRAQFGYLGVIVPLVGTAFTFLGFNVVDALLMSSGLKSLFGWPPTVVILAVSGAAVLLAIYGHDWLHRAFKALLVVSLPLYVILSGYIILAGAHAQASPHALGFSLTAFAAQFAASASYNITYGPYVSDYSRYLPHDTPSGRVIAAVFAGASASAIWLILIGAWLAAQFGATDALQALDQSGNLVVYGFGAFLALSSVAAMMATMGLNAYSAALTFITGLTCFIPVKPGVGLRVGAILVSAAIWVAVSLSVSGDAVEILDVVLTAMLYLLSPWTAVSLVDYFLVRKGRYATLELFKPDGIYGRWSAGGLVAYAAGLACSVPFFELPKVFVGPAAKRMGDVDVAWLVGMVVAALAYMVAARSIDLGREAAVVAESEQALEGA